MKIINIISFAMLFVVTIRFVNEKKMQFLTLFIVMQIYINYQIFAFQIVL